MNAVILDFTFSPLRPSLVAAGAVFAATLGLQGADWAEKHNVLGLLQNLTHCEEVNDFSVASKAERNDIYFSINSE